MATVGTSQDTDIVAQLAAYRDDPTYAQCYEGIVTTLATIGYVSGKPLGAADCVRVYDEVRQGIESVLGSAFPEIQLTSVHAAIRARHCDSNEEPGDGITVSIMTAERMLGILTEMVFVIVLWDKMTEKNDMVRRAFTDCRTWLENADYNRPYVTNPLWRLIAQRIPPAGQPRLEDLQAEIGRLTAEMAAKDLTIARKDEQVTMLELGYKTEEDGLTAYGAAERIQALHMLLGLPSSLEGEQRAQFKSFAAFMTKARDTTLERLLSQNSLTRMTEGRDALAGKYPILLSAQRR